MAAIGDHYIATLRGRSTINSQAIQNTFCYELESGVGGAAALGDILNTVIMPPLLDVLSNLVFFDDWYIINLETPTDFADVAINLPGNHAGDSMPSFVAWEFEYVRASRAVNNGRKAFGLISENDVANGGAVGGLVTPLNTLGNWLGSDLVDTGATMRFGPRIWRRPGTYASGVVAAPGAFFEIVNVLYRRVSSQNTRKTGRGA